MSKMAEGFSFIRPLNIKIGFGHDSILFGQSAAPLTVLVLVKLSLGKELSVLFALAGIGLLVGAGLSRLFVKTPPAVLMTGLQLCMFRDEVLSTIQPHRGMYFLTESFARR